uniref:WD repeat-containing protein 35 isoform X2 n=1 Tax=Myxine glutinosa TaxID=7769 RepID=UPI00358FD466
MFLYLINKWTVADHQLRCIAWSKDQGDIALGGDCGFLNVIKLEPGVDAKAVGLGASNNLCTVNQPEGHKGSVKVLSWNDRYEKLTSSDETGFTIVWMLHNGNRIWGNRMKHMQFTQVAWSPDGCKLLFGLASGDVHISDGSGNFLAKMELQCMVGRTEIARIVSLQWYNGRWGYFEPDCPSLAVCLDNGCCQLMRTENDNDVILLDTGMKIVDAQWNHCGSMLAIACCQQINSSQSLSEVQFYSPFGEHLRTLPLASKRLLGLAWDGAGCRIALALDTLVLFANVRPEYKWAYVRGTLVYAYTNRENAEHRVMFWNTKNGDKTSKFVHGLRGISACDDVCLLSASSDNSQEMYKLLLCNDIGTQLDSKYLDTEPRHIAVTRTHVVVASRTEIYVWHYRVAKRLTAMDVQQGAKPRWDGREKVYDIDHELKSGDRAAVDTKTSNPTRDPICCIAALDKTLIVAQGSGTLMHFILPGMELQRAYTTSQQPCRIFLNCNCSRLAILDSAGLLTLMELESQGASKDSCGKILSLQRKDVWDVCWASDDPEFFAAMERTWMYVFRNLDPEEPILTSGYICGFEHLEIKSALLDEIMKEPENPKDELVVTFEARFLRDCHTLVESVGLPDAQQFVERNPHPRLWRLLAGAALEQLQLEVADHAFARCHDYPGLQLIKRLHSLTGQKLKQAEVAAYFGRFEEAEELYLSMDRRDLALKLRTKLGDWFRVLQLLSTTAGNADDALKEQANNSIGEYYAERKKWSSSVKYYMEAHNMEQLAECYIMLEDYEKLSELASSLPEQHKLLPKLGQVFLSVGMCQEAIDAFLRNNQPKLAINACVELNKWKQAVELAQFHNVHEVRPLLAKYVARLLENGQQLEAVELYRIAHCHLEAAQLLFQLADKEAKMRRKPLLAKKIFVLAALEVESYHEMKRSQKKDKTEAASALVGLLEEDATAGGLMVDLPWRGAEAYHFYLLAQRQFYSGQPETATATAKVLVDYEDIIPPEDIYSLLALFACKSGAFKTASRAFLRLETMPGLSEKEKRAYEQCALEVFTKHKPYDTSKSEESQSEILEGIFPEEKPPVCVVTGRLLTDYELWMCSACKHCAGRLDISSFSTCPLCHSSVL